MTDQEKKDLEMRQCERMCGDIFGKETTVPDITPEERAERKKFADRAIEVACEFYRKHPLKK